MYAKDIKTRISGRSRSTPSNGGDVWCWQDISRGKSNGPPVDTEQHEELNIPDTSGIMPARSYGPDFFLW